MAKITIPLDGKPYEEIEKSGVKMFIGWDRLRPHIETAIMLRPGEIIDGYSVDENGIKVSISRIRGRKSGGEENNAE